MQHKLVDCGLLAAERVGGNPSWPGFWIVQPGGGGVQQRGVLQQLVNCCPQASGHTVVDDLAHDQGPFWVIKQPWLLDPLELAEAQRPDQLCPGLGPPGRVDLNHLNDRI